MYSCTGFRPESYIPYLRNNEEISTNGRFSMISMESYYKWGFGLVYNHFVKLNPTLNFKKIRYCVILNSNVIKQSQYRMKIREAATKSFLIDLNDSSKRLLFINQDDAVALNLLHSYDDLKLQQNDSYYLMIFVENSEIQISVYQSAQIHGSNSYSDRTFNNMRKIISSTFKFDIVNKLSTRLDSLLATRPEYHKCSSNNVHDRHCKTYFYELRACFLKFLKVWI